jgi:dihydroxyacetone kinase-like protein
VNAHQLRRVLADALVTLEASREELRDLDAAMGDGDLGVTVSAGARAAREGVDSLPDDTTPVQILRTVAQRFASANPSTMSALVAAGLLAGAKRIPDTRVLDRSAAVLLLRAATEAIQARGGARVGDKTIVDALVPSLAALESAGPSSGEALAAMQTAAALAITATAGLQSMRGRAAWVGERSVGHPDAGATAFLRLLEALSGALPDNLPMEV